MSLIIFIIVLAILIFVHELGHFLAAKVSGIRVDEFAIGFPPRIASFKPKKSETRYSLGAVPFGGFVKIFGEDPSEEAKSGPDKKRSFQNKPKSVQAFVLAAGVLGNLLFAWLLISLGFSFGLPASAEFGERGVVEDAKVTVTAVLPNSPAEGAGFQAGDRVLFLEAGGESLQGGELTAESVQGFISENLSQEIIFLLGRGEESLSVSVVPELGVFEEYPAIGVGLDTVGIVKLPVHIAFIEGAKVTVELLRQTAVGLSLFIAQIFTGAADFSQIAGPVGIVGLVGGASELGFMYLVSFTAFISINLALINLIPFPALDGGRILFVLIEKLKGSPIRPAVANTLNTVGFALLILLMLVVTYNDIFRIFTGG